MVVAMSNYIDTFTDADDVDIVEPEIEDEQAMLDEYLDWYNDQMRDYHNDIMGSIRDQEMRDAQDAMRWDRDNYMTDD